MTDLPFFSPLNPVPAESGRNFIKGAFEGLMPIVVFVGAVIWTVYQRAEEVERNAHENHLRAERLAAYRARHRWKASDVRPLLSIGVNEAAQRRMARLKGKGRPVVKMHRPLEDVLCSTLTNWSLLFRDDAMPTERRSAFKVWPLWKHHVEALYRGELERARASQVRGAHDDAERAVASALRMSQGTVHAICGEVRSIRREDAEAANFPPMVLTEYEEWMERGELPESLAGK